MLYLPSLYRKSAGDVEDKEIGEGVVSEILEQRWLLAHSNSAMNDDLAVALANKLPPQRFGPLALWCAGRI